MATEGSLANELAVHKKVHDAQLGPDVRVNRLLGIVHLREEDATLGLLLAIDHEEGRTLQSAIESGQPAHLWEQWATQVRHTVEKLHKAGATWGDAKAENVLVDKEEEAWVIDFEGGSTQGWVGKDKAGTKEGDLQGLGKIFDLISNGPTAE